MKYSIMAGVIAVTVIISISPLVVNFASGQTMPWKTPRVQWQLNQDISQIACKEEMILLTKSNGMPACVYPASYLSLVDRGWGMWNATIMMDRPQMMNTLMGQIMDDPQLRQQVIQMMTRNQMIGNMTTMKEIMEEQARSVVSDAVALYDLKGVEAFKIITLESANLKPGELYPFVLDPINITVVAHGFDPSKVGTKSVSLTESNRTYEQILDDLKNNNGMWVEYRYVNSDTQEEQIKKTWLYTHDDYIFACGYYLPN